jgi:hypothetical protein
VRVGGLDPGEHGAAVGGEGEFRLSLEVSAKLIAEFYPVSLSCLRIEYVVHFANVEA